MEECVIYARVSDKDKQGDGFSIPAQLELLRAYAVREGLRVIQEFIDMETARKPGRTQFNHMLDLLKKRKKPTALLVEKTDRLYRNLPDYIETDALINKKGLEIHFVKESEIDSKSASSNAKFMRGIKVLLAKQYVENLSEEVKKGQRQKIKEGGWCWIAPYGYQMEKGELIIHPERAAFVQRAFELYARGNYSIQATIQRLHAEGYIYKPHSIKIGKTKLNEILRSRLYMGEIEYNGEVFEGKHPALVSRATWLSAQNALRKGNKPMTFTKNDFLYKGLLKCGECGKAMVGEEKKGGRYTYYRCCDFKKSCSQGYISESAITNAINSAFEGLLFTGETKQQIKAALNELGPMKDNTVEDEAERIKKEIVRLSRNRRMAYQDKLDGNIDEAMWQEFNDDYNEQMAALENRQKNFRKAEDNFYDQGDLYIELPELLNGKWIEANFDQKKKILFFTTSNLIAKDGNVDVELNEPFLSLKNMRGWTEWRDTPDRLRTVLMLHSATIRAVHQALSA